MPDGVTNTIDARDPVSDQILQSSTSRGSTKYTKYFRFDGREREESSWDSVPGTAGVANPTYSFSYTDAITTRPGSMLTAVNPTGTATSRSLLFQSAGGAQIGSAVLTPQGWAFGDLELRAFGAGYIQTQLRPPLPPGDDADSLSFADLFVGAQTIATLTTTVSGDVSATTRKFQSDDVVHGVNNVQKMWGTVTSTDGGFTSRSTRDLQGRIISNTDAGERSWNYAYDWLGRLRRIQLPTGGSVAIQTDVHGRVATISRVDTSPGNRGQGSVTYQYQAATGLPDTTIYSRPDGTGRAD